MEFDVAVLKKKVDKKHNVVKENTSHVTTTSEGFIEHLKTESEQRGNNTKLFYQTNM